MSKINVNISIDPELKKAATFLFKELGLDFSTAVTLFLKQSVLKQKIPFEISTDLFNEDTIKAFNEFEEMRNNPDKYSRYNSFKELLEELDDEKCGCK